jgi:DNA-binding NtrC family response regulator
MNQPAERTVAGARPTRKGRVLIVDDDVALNEALSGLLSHAGYETVAASSGGEALAALRRHPVDLVLLDLRLGHENGLDIMAEIKKVRAEVSVVVITAMGSIETAVQAMQAGADNFVAKPLDPPRLLATVAKGVEARGLRARSLQLERIEGGTPAGIIGPSTVMSEAVRMAAAVAAHDTTVLLCGETGTGKGLLARYIRDCSVRRKQPFVELNCAGLQRDLTESELFGHEKGAFTGATERKLGLFEAASGGTLFLDEIGEMESGIQSKLLKAIEEKTFRRLGGLAEIEVDARVIVATHRNLEQDVAEGRFRQDLFYRLSVFSIRLPALRERRDDIVPLAWHFLKQSRPSAGAQISPDAMALLEAYDWPGNVRELRNVMERACILATDGGDILPAHLPPLTPGGVRVPLNGQERLTLRETERAEIERALDVKGGNIKATARALGISRATLYRKAKRYCIPV